MTSILHISDTHFGTEQPPVLAALAAFTRTLVPDLLILSGDITQRARPAQFAAAARFVRELNVPNVLAVPGNHDVPLFDLATRFFASYSRYRTEFGDDLEPGFQTSDCLVAGVNTTRRYRHVDGEISEAQRDRVAEHLSLASAGQLRIVVQHHPVATPRASEQHNAAHGSVAAVRAWSAAGADLILAGHIHLPFILPLHEAMGPLPKPLWAVNAGTAVSSRTRRDAGNSVNVIQTSAEVPRACLVEHWAYQSSNTSFVRTAKVPLVVSSLGT